MEKWYRVVYRDGTHGAWNKDYEEVKAIAKFFRAEIEERAW